MNQILTETIEIDYSGLKGPLDIEHTLKKRYGNVIRWAIISVTGDKAKVSVTYEEFHDTKHHS